MDGLILRLQETPNGDRATRQDYYEQADVIAANEDDEPHQRAEVQRAAVREMRRVPAETEDEQTP